MTEWVDEVNGSVKYDMALQFDPDKSPLTAFLKAMKNFEENLRMMLLKLQEVVWKEDES